MTTPRYDQIVLTPGDAAPPFELPCYPLGPVATEALLEQGPLILSFYVQDDAPGSIRQVRMFSANIDEFTARHATIACASFDDLESHKRMALAHKIDPRVLLLSDTTHDTARAYGAVYGDRNIAEQITFVIDMQGIIRFVVAGMPDAQSLLNALATLP